MQRPQARRSQLRTETSAEGGLVIYDQQTDAGHVLNPTSAAVFELADGTRSVPQIAQSLAERGELPADEEIVLLALQELDQAGLLELTGPSGPKVSRRKLLSRLAMGAPAAALLPGIDSINSMRGLTGTTAAVTICHKPGTPDQQTMNVPLAVALLHLLHGDTLGPCPPGTTAAPGSTTAAPGSTTPPATTTAGPATTRPPATTTAFPTTTAAF
jgi:hypothetical protein